MAKPWDDSLKQLVRANPRAFVKWLLSRAQFVSERPYELKTWKLEVDALILVTLDGQEMLLHIEFQTYNDPSMPERLLRYNVLARSEYNLPVLSFVIYLLKDGNIPQSPLRWTVPTGQEVLQFYFENIELGELSTEELLQFDLVELLPLLSLTRNGAKRELVEMMDIELTKAGRTDLVQIGYTLASLAFRHQKNIADQDWLIRRLHEMHDILRETPIYQEILKEGREEGLQEGLEQGRREGSLQALRHTLLSIVQTRFPSPKIIRQAKGQAAIIEDPAVLESLIIKVGLAQTLEEAQNYLLEWPSTDNEQN